MKLDDKDVKRLAVILLVIVLAVLAFMILKPILISIFAGLLLAYVFAPVYNWTVRRLKNRSLSALSVIALFTLIVLIPIWLLIPTVAQQVFEVFKALQTFDLTPMIRNLFPSASDQFVVQIATAFQSFTSKFASSLMNYLLDTFLELPSLALNLMIVIFVFFFGLRDKAELNEFIAGLSPLSKAKEELFIRQFKDITDSILYGQIIVGVVQGAFAGLSFFVFGVPNAFVLTILAILLAVIPMVGPMFVWIPVTFYLFAHSSTLVVIIYLLYNILFVSTIDNVIRTYLIISKHSGISTAIVLIGMIGGLILFGFLGLIIGPLVLAYLVTFLKAYKEKKWASLFADE